MRIALVVAVVMVAACASEKLKLEPPPGVNFSGHWQLNAADSDDPNHLSESQNAADAAAAAASGGSGSPGGSGQGRRGGGSNGGGMGVAGGPSGPMMPSVGALGEGLHWPGKLLEIKQVAGVVAFTSDGRNLVCQPTVTDKKQRRHGTPADDGGSRRDRAWRGRDTQPVCGWADKTLIVRGGDPDSDLPPYEEHYGISDDGRRLVEVVSFKGGRSSGFTMSRVWDKLP